MKKPELNLMCTLKICLHLKTVKDKASNSLKLQMVSRKK